MNIKLLLCTLIFSGSVVAKDIAVKHANTAPIIDGINNEKVWQQATWYPMDVLMDGTLPSAQDFSGRYRLLWDENYLYLQAEITDDILFDQHADPLYFYWDDDCLEIFIDEDASGGDHQTNFNAFAYHVALDNQAIDIGPNNKDGSTQFVALNDHVNSRWQRQLSAPNTVIWEVAIAIYDDTFTLEGEHTPVKLSAEKIIGFMLAYCDNDGSKHREHFMGSHDFPAVNGSKNLGYMDASVFGKIVLKK
ncbi:CBM9 family sugar-binding protein [Thalassotalea agarivorans]|uniref:Carbohydrate family 9 binding domain-like n=1 Tax=Thalassotalea agarivorans TaxID=349064 RepID=A0A1I0E1H9_THASX|nr:CBM9 family sugar-binding protein [Thalassotalea agarivorans]SET38804.1 Carbohydrate family 9 binding domain-like [Thalassotalea agarivorans]